MRHILKDEKQGVLMAAAAIVLAVGTLTVR